MTKITSNLFLSHMGLLWVGEGLDVLDFDNHDNHDPEIIGPS
jgi:uncharacterized membrane protein